MSRLPRVLLALPLALAGAGAGWVIGHSRDIADPGDADLAIERRTIPPDENGYPALEAAAAKLDWPDADAEWLQSVADGARHNRERARAFLARNQAALELVDLALARPALQLPPRWNRESSPTALSQALSRWALLGTLLRLRAWAEAETRNPAVALEGLVHAAELGRRIAEADGGGTVEAATGMTIRSSALLGLRSFASDTPIGREEALRFDAALSRLALDPAAWRRSLAIDYLRAKSTTLDTMSRWEGEARPAWIALTRAIQAPAAAALLVLPDAYHVQPRRTLAALAASVRAPPGDSDGLCATLPPREAGGAGAERERTLGILRAFLPNARGAMLVTERARGLRRLQAMRCAHEAALAATRAHLALRAFFSDHGSLPASLAELVPDYLDTVPRDPFGGAELRYSAERRSLWSIGDDLRDAGGRLGHDERSTAEPTFALVFGAPLGEAAGTPTEATRRSGTAAPGEGPDARADPAPRSAASPVEAPASGPLRGDVEKHEAVEHRELALVHDRRPMLQAVGHPVGDGHHAGTDEGGPARVKADRDREAAEQLDRARRVPDRIGHHSRRHADRPADELLEPVGEEEQPRHNTHHCVGLGLKPPDESCHPAVPPSGQFSRQRISPAGDACRWSST